MTYESESIPLTGCNTISSDAELMTCINNKTIRPGMLVFITYVVNQIVETEQYYIEDLKCSINRKQITGVGTFELQQKKYRVVLRNLNTNRITSTNIKNLFDWVVTISFDDFSATCIHAILSQHGEYKKPDNYEDFYMGEWEEELDMDNVMEEEFKRRLLAE